MFNNGLVAQIGRAPYYHCSFFTFFRNIPVLLLAYLLINSWLDTVVYFNVLKSVVEKSYFVWVDGVTGSNPVSGITSE